jgi:hypothetical protein
LRVADLATVHHLLKLLRDPDPRSRVEHRQLAARRLDLLRNPPAEEQLLLGAEQGVVETSLTR